MVSRRKFCTIFSAACVSVAAPVYSKTPGFLKNAGDIRLLRLKNNKTSENINLVYWIEGSYVSEAVKEISYFMRDWRQNKIINYNVANVDIIAATQALLDTNETMQLLSGYRTAKTNRMLAYSNSGVARNSYHIKGMAADLSLANRSVSQISRAAQACRSGGVGSYNNSGFVHIDCGPVRTWKR